MKAQSVTVDPLVLAAGLGRRMGAVKPLVEIDGVPAIVRVLHCIEAAGLHSPLLILGRSHREIRTAIGNVDYRIELNHEPERGLASSLAIGLGAISGRADGVLLFHADMPFIHSETVAHLAASLDSADRIVAPFDGVRRGFPLYLNRSTFRELVPSLHGDIGARRYIASHPDDVRLVPVDDPGCFFDFDWPEDLLRYGKESACSTYA